MILYQNKEWLENQYITLRKSIQQIATEINIGHTTINTWLIKLNIPRRSNSEANKGKPKSEEHKRKLSEIGKRRITSEETRRKMSISGSGKNNSNWKGGRRKDGKGCILIWNSTHPYRRKDNYIFEHRLVIEVFLKDYIDPENVVHHINGIKDDNRLSNLMLFKNTGEHTKYHDILRKRDVGGRFS